MTLKCIRFTSLAVWAAGAFLTPQAAHANLWVLSSVSPGQFSPDSSKNANVGSPYFDGLDTTGGPVSTGKLTLSSQFGNSTYSGSASASASYNLLKAYAKADIANFAPRSYITTQVDTNSYVGSDPARGSAIIRDQLTITGGDGDGYAFFNFGGDGIANSSGSLSLGTQFQALGVLELFLPDENGEFQIHDVWNMREPGSFAFTSQAVPFTYGVPIDFVITLDALVVINDYHFTQSYDAHGVADFGDTAFVQSVLVSSDPDGLTPAAAIIGSASGASYTHAAATPEPSTWVMMLSGFVSIGMFGRRRFKTTRLRAS